MAEGSAEARQLATLALALELAEGDHPVTPPWAVATGLPGSEIDAQRLTAQLNLAAQQAFRSRRVEIDGTRFTDVRPGHVKAILHIIGSDDSLWTVDRFAGGLTSLTDRSRKPLEDYLRSAAASKALSVTVSDSQVEHPGEAVPKAPRSLTRHQRRQARIALSLALVLVALFVLAVLNVPPFGLGLPPLIWRP